MSGATCRGCGAPIVWAITSSGKKVPLDPPEKRYVEAKVGRVEVRDTWLSHFATCPDHADFRRPS